MELSIPEDWVDKVKKLIIWNFNSKNKSLLLNLLLKNVLRNDIGEIIWVHTKYKWFTAFSFVWLSNDLQTSNSIITRLTQQISTIIPMKSSTCASF